MKKFTPYILSCIVSLFYPFLNTQAQSSVTAATATSSPEALSSSKYGDVSVSLYTGIPNIDVPIWILKGRAMQLPVGLNYYAGGIRVEEIASRVGIGWSLQAGGVITRTVKGLPDESPKGYLSNYKWKGPIKEQTDPAFYSFLRENIEGNNDSEPDVFYFNFAGHSGSFVFDSIGNILQIPFSDLKIVRDKIPNSTNFMWTITTTDGTKYIFSETETTEQTTWIKKDANTFSSIKKDPYVSAWYLSKIVTAYDDETIALEYEPYIVNYQQPGGETSYKYISKTHDGITCGDFSEESTDNLSLKGKRLSKITSVSESIIFTKGNPRCDLIGDFTLGSIDVYDRDQKFLRKFIPEYSYFRSDEDDSSCNAKNSVNLRLRLDSIMETTPDCNIRAPYKFVYEKDINKPFPDLLKPFMPNRFSKAQDHWGFYNGKDENMELVPATKTVIDGQLIDVPGGNRNPEAYAMAIGSLQKIIYPSGASTSFEFEPHEYYSDYNETSYTITDSPLKSVSTSAAEGMIGSETFTVSGAMSAPGKIFGDVYCPGLNGYACNSEIKLIDVSNNKTIAQLNTTANKKFLDQAVSLIPGRTYKITASCVQDGYPSAYANIKVEWTEKKYVPVYSPSNKTAGGLRIKQVTTYDGFDSTKNIVKKYIYKDESNPQKSSGTPVTVPYYHHEYAMGAEGKYCNFLVRSSFSQLPLGTTQGSHVGYHTVTVVHGANGEGGKEIFKYTSPLEYPNTNKFAFPFPTPVNQDHKRGFLKEKKVFDNKGNLTATELKEYLFEDEKGIIRGSARGIKAGILKYSASEKTPTYPSTQYAVASYTFTSSAKGLLKKSTDRFYNPKYPGKYIENATEYFYDNPNRLYVTRKTEKTPEGNERIYLSKYTSDYNTEGAQDDASKAISFFNTKNITVPIEQQLREVKTGLQDTTVRGATLFLYKEFAPGKTYLSQVLKPENEKMLQNFQTSSVEGGKFLYDLRYRTQSVSEKYDLYGNLIQQRIPNMLPSASFWEFDGTFKTVEAMNAAASDIAYTSFEELSESWSFNKGEIQQGECVTGKKYLKLTTECTLNFTGTPGKYKLSFYAWGNGEVTVSGPVKINIPINGATPVLKTLMLDLAPGISIYLEASGDISIDELRLHPEKALMTTYTYQPSVGITSACDPFNKVVYTEYDDFDRPVLARDRYKNIVAAASHMEVTQDKRILGTLKATPEIVIWGESVQLDASASCNLELPGTTFTWDFGDGNTEQTNTPQVNHTYLKPGNYTVKLKMKKNSYPESETQLLVKVTADFIAAPQPVKWGQTIQFDASQHKGVTKYAWLLGDATPKIEGPDAIVKHVYGISGTPWVWLTMSKPGFPDVTVHKYITVTKDEFKAAFNKFSPAILYYGDEGTYKVEASGGIPPYSYFWEIKELLPGYNEGQIAWKKILKANTNTVKRTAYYPFYIRCTTYDGDKSGAQSKKILEMFVDVPDSPYYKAEPCNNCPIDDYPAP